MNDNSSVENLFLMLHKWRDSSSLIKVFVVMPFWSAQLWVRVVSADQGKVIFKSDDNFGILELTTEGVVWSYQEPREANASVRAEAEVVAECAIELLFPDRTLLRLYEWRESVE
jgi:hypothetical protein